MTIEPEIIEPDEPPLDNYAIRIQTGRIDIKIFPDGKVEGWPSNWSSGQFLLFNRIPALVAAAEQIGHSLGYTQAEEDLQAKTQPTVIKQPLAGEEDREAPKQSHDAYQAIQDLVNGRK